MAKEKTYDVFISYRRQGGAEKAELVKGELVKRGFRESRMFMDTRSLSSGNYMESILRALNASQYNGTLCLDRVKPLVSQSFLGAEPSR